MTNVASAYSNHIHKHLKGPASPLHELLYADIHLVTTALSLVRGELGDARPESLHISGMPIRRLKGPDRRELRRLMREWVRDPDHHAPLTNCREFKSSEQRSDIRRVIEEYIHGAAFGR
jgi:hypothetical protein